MDASSFCAGIQTRKIERTLTYSGTPVITITILYPQVALARNPAAQGRINGRIQTQVRGFFQEASTDLYRQAVADYQNAQANGFPFHPHDAMLRYTVTYNRNCHLSLYRDQYTYTGGAHGNTIRASDTWSLESGQVLPLSALFPEGQDYRARILEAITRQADQQMQQNPGIFFENYRELMAQYFNAEHYYLTPAGVAIYYQQYEIAPYATGIVVFTVPYAEIGWHPACC